MKKNNWYVEHSGYDFLGMPVVGIKTPLGPNPTTGIIILHENKEVEFYIHDKLAFLC
jgi:hypothetical protein